MAFDLMTWLSDNYGLAIIISVAVVAFAVSAIRKKLQKKKEEETKPLQQETRNGFDTVYLEKNFLESNYVETDKLKLLQKKKEDAMQEFEKIKAIYMNAGKRYSELKEMAAGLEQVMDTLKEDIKGYDERIKRLEHERI